MSLDLDNVNCDEWSDNDFSVEPTDTDQNKNLALDTPESNKGEGELEKNPVLFPNGVIGDGVTKKYHQKEAKNP